MVIFRVGKRLLIISSVEFICLIVMMYVMILLKQYIVMLICCSLLIYLIVGFTDLFSMRYYLTEDFIRFKSTTHDNILYFSQIKKVKKLKPGLFMKFEVGFYSETSKIVITGYTKNSEKLISNVLKKCEKNSGIDIDSSIYKLAERAR